MLGVTRNKMGDVITRGESGILWNILISIDSNIILNPISQFNEVEKKNILEKIFVRNSNQLSNIKFSRVYGRHTCMSFHPRINLNKLRIKISIVSKIKKSRRIRTKNVTALFLYAGCEGVNNPCRSP